MKKDNKTIYLFVVNPISGGIDKQLILDFILRRSKSEGFIFELYKTTGESDEQKISELIGQHHPEVVVAVGGDGTLMMLAKMLKNSGTQIGLIPSGSANGMAAELGIPQVKGLTESARLDSLEEIWAQITSGKIREIDLVKVNQTFSLHLADAGLNARIVRDFDKDDQRGFLGYARQFVKEIADTEKFGYAIHTDEHRHTGKAFMIVVANARRYGTGAIINPQGKLDDGKVELCIVKSLNVMLLIHAITSIITEDPSYHPDDLEVISCRNAQIEIDHEEILQVDGEVIGEANNIEVDVLPKAVQLRCKKNN